MRSFLLHVFFLPCLLFCSVMHAQNLVPNPSFEDHNGCATFYSNISFDTSYSYFPYLDKWVIVSSEGTSDYYNVCSPTGVGVPKNFVGYQWPRTGDAYVGIYAVQFRTGTTSAIYHSNYDYREHVQAKLIDSMKIGHQYFVSFYVNLSNVLSQSELGGSSVEGFQSGIDKIGMLFTDTLLYYKGFFPDNGSVAASITNPAGRYITDTADWVKVQGIYTATTNKRFVTLGYFEAHNQISYKPLFTLNSALDSTYPRKSYLLIDDVCVFDMANAVIKNNDKVVCNVPAIIKGNVPGSMYLWSTGDTTAQITVRDTGTYYLQTWGECMYHIDTFHVYLQPVHTYGSSIVCRGDTNTMAWVTPAVGDTMHYTSTWYNASGKVIHSSSYNGVGDTLKGLDTGLYTVTISSGNCDTTLVITIVAPTYKSSFTVDSIICQNETVTFQNTSTNDLSAWYWSFGNGDTTTQKNPEYTYREPGTYRVVLTAANSVPCYDSVSAMVIVDALPFISFATDKEKVCVGQTIAYNPHYESAMDTLLWDFGDGAALYNGLQPIHAYSDAGNMVVTVTTKSRACPDTTFKDTITVNAYPRVNIGTDTSICRGQAPIILTNLYNAGPIDQAKLWSTGDTGNRISIHRGQ